MSDVNYYNYSEISPQIMELSEVCIANGRIDIDLYEKYKVNRGLRDVNGKGVLTGLTDISEITAHETDENGNTEPCDGKLFYRGRDINDIVQGFVSDDRYGFEEVVYLLLFGELPDEEDLKSFDKLLAKYRNLPPNFVRDVIMKAPSGDMMNMLSRSVLTLYSYDDKADDISIPNVLRQCIQLIAIFPLLAVYAYQAYRHYKLYESLIIHRPLPELSTAENILRMLRPDSKYTDLEAKILDLALVLHAEHGGGNNSSFTTHVVSSSGTDTYSTIAASLGSLKGPKHGGANIKVIKMVDDLKNYVKGPNDKDGIAKYLEDILYKRAFDQKGLIYGIGHAIYSKSDPRAVILKKFAKKLSEEKGLKEEFDLYRNIEKIAPEIVAKHRKMYKGISANVDFYSGFVYKMLDLPIELYTPIFAVSRVSGWSAHRIEELANAGKIIRPAYKSVAVHKSYVPMSERP